MPLTPSQLQAVQARGNVLVVAGAGTGKTSTLVERCLDLLLTEHCSITEILMVTFTEAAAAEMRGRVRAELQVRIQGLADIAQAAHLRQQWALLDTAHIGTLHSFCLKLARQHFYALGLDPAVMVLDERQTAPLATKALDKLFQRHYAGDAPEDKAARDLIEHLGQGLDDRIRRLMRGLHAYAQSLEDPEGWLKRQEQLFAQPEPDQWRQWFLAAFPGWCRRWGEALSPHAAVPGIARCLCELERAASHGADTCEQAGTVLTGLVGVMGDKSVWPKGSKGDAGPRLRRFRVELEFLAAALVAPDGSDPVAQDWAWVREHLGALLRLTREFDAAFSREKRDQGGVDFADLEQCALRVLRDPISGEPTPIARQWQQRLRFIFVDEYQDINPAQDAILKALSREGTDPNRFLVGDVKQSIYRFRRANPGIFRDYEARWRLGAKAGRRIPLAENFRGREALLGFINPLFAALMRPAFGVVDYPADAHLRFGAPEERRHLSLAAGPGPNGEPAAPRVELHLIDQDDDSGAGEPDSEEAQAVLLDLLAIQREARLVALRLRELQAQKHLVWDPDEQVFRAVEWRDMVVLLRSPASRAEAFAQEFNRQGVPLSAARPGFFASLEVSDLINLLKLLDNPLQDLPLLAVLRSPLAGFSLDELVLIRARSPAKPFWRALLAWPQHPAGDAAAPETPLELTGKVKDFIEQFERWRQRTRQSSIAECLEAVLVQTHYEALLLAEPRGDERVANVRRLLALARAYDPYQRQGLYRFLRFVKLQEEEELEQEPAAAQTENAVRLMSIHKAKGLEFPVVLLAGLGVRFNFQDLSREILLHERYGLCPRVKPPDTDLSYPSLTHWLARQEERRELIGEELRLLYVALTRARDTLILTGTGRGPAWGSQPERMEDGAWSVADFDLLHAQSCLDWLRLWLPHVTTGTDWTGDRAGANPLLRWRLYAANDPRLLLKETADSSATPPAGCGEELDQRGLLKLQERLLWQYPHAAATREPAIKRISELVRAGTAGDEAQALFTEDPWGPAKPRVRAPVPSKLGAADAGSAHHRFLELIKLERVGSLAELKAEAQAMVRDGLLSEPEAQALDFEALLCFWQGETGRRILGQANSVHREIPFTARFTPEDLTALGLCPNAAELQGEYFVTRGKADLAVILPGEIWLLDFKTDRVREAAFTETIERYSRQLKLYALGLGRIYRRPVTERWLHFLALNRTVSVGT